MKRILFILAILLCTSLVLAGGVAGSWDFKAESSNGETYELTLTLKEADGKVTGDLGNYDGSVPLEKVELKENKLTFDLTTPEGTTYSTDLTVKDETMDGTYKGTDGTTGKITAKKATKE